MQTDAVSARACVSYRRRQGQVCRNRIVNCTHTHTHSTRTWNARSHFRAPFGPKTKRNDSTLEDAVTVLLNACTAVGRNDFKGQTHEHSYTIAAAEWLRCFRNNFWRCLHERYSMSSHGNYLWLRMSLIIFDRTIFRSPSMPCPLLPFAIFLCSAANIQNWP